jgi:hypothetical protein
MLAVIGVSVCVAVRAMLPMVRQVIDSNRAATNAAIERVVVNFIMNHPPVIYNRLKPFWLLFCIHYSRNFRWNLFNNINIFENLTDNFM